MKITNIIQKLCLFIILATLNCVVWAQEVTFDAVDYSRGDPITRIKKDAVTIEFTKSEISSHLISSKRRFRLKGGGTMTVSVAPGYRIREIYCIENTSKGVYLTSGTNGYEASHDEKKLYYRKLYSWDAPSASVLCKNSSRKDDCEFRFIRIRYVEEGNVRFFKHEHLAYAMSPPFKAGLVLKGHTGNQHYRSSDTNVAEVGNDGTITPKHVGTATISVSLDATIDYAKAECSTKVFVKRDNVTFYLNGVENFMLSKGSNAGRALPNAFSFVKTLTASNTEFQHNNPGFSITSSNPEVIRVTDAKEGNLAFGGTTGKATLTFRQEETDRYDAHSFSQEFIVVRTDENNTVLIKDKNEWEMFAFMVNEVGLNALNAYLETDINLGSDIVMVGRGGHKYAGTFNGNGHSITMNWTGDNIAPFNLVEGATFMNLRTKGQITVHNEFASGLISEAYASCTISNCVSEVNIKSEGNHRSGSAGFIKRLKTSAKVTFDDCISAGTFTGSTGAAKEGWAGFVRYNNGECKLNNCLYIGTNNANKDSYTFAPNAKAKNCYYRDTCGEAQGEQVTADQLKNGEVAYNLQNGRNNTVWGQAFGSDEPRLTDNVEYRVYKVDFTYNSQVRATRYATRNKHIYGSMPTVQEILGTDYNPQHYYSGLTFADNFSGSTSVTADKQVAVSFTHKEVCEIASKADWKEFCDLVNGGQTKLNAKMTANVDLGSDITMAGTPSMFYAGTFDGQNHTLTLNWNTNACDIAPFRRVKDAIIKNLRTEGTIKSSGYFLAGLIDEASGGNNTVSNCVSAVNITSSYTGDRCGAGGLISYIFTDTHVTINDCLVKGSINATEAGRKGMGGFVYVQNGTCTMTHCLYLGENNADNSNNRSYTFAYNTPLTNCYYLNPCGKAQGDRVTEEQLKNGEVPYKLQNGRNTQFWGQNLDTDNEPQLTADAAKHVYEVKFTYNNKVAATRYANSGKAIAGGMPTLTAKDLLGTGYNPHHYYTIAFAGGFNGSTTVNTDRTVTVTLTEKDYYEIASKEDWKEFCDLVNDGHTAVDAKMTADVDLSTDIVMVADRGGNYAGTFDGQGHTLTVNWDGRTGAAPFQYVEGATIKNLRTKGKIQGYSRLAGLIHSVYGNTTVSGCVSEVDIKGTYSLAGMIYKMDNFAKVTMTDCVVKGDITATTEDGKKQMAGFIFDIGGNKTLTNCLYLGKNNATEGRTFGWTPNITNCYFLNACGNEQGEKITEEQLKNGYVAYKLQNGRNTQFWGQNLDTDNEPQLTADAAKHVYEVKFTYNNKVAATRYANSGKAIAGGMPSLTAKDLLGTGYNPHHYYTIAFADGFNGSTTVDADRTVTVTLTEKDCYEIASKEDWKAFRDLVNDGQPAVDGKLTKDVDLGTEILMVGYSWPNIYSGTFDGQGHTLSFDWDGGGRSEIAPFKYVKDATIRNLRTKGKIKSLAVSSSGWLTGSQLSGLIQNAEGTTTISNCVSEVDLNATGSLAGILQWPDGEAHITINDCLVKGTFQFTPDKNDPREDGTGKNLSGFIAHMPLESTCTLNNCLYLGTNNALDYDESSHTFCVNNPPSTTITNCYYLNACGEAQGTRVTEEQLKNSHVAKLLQAGRTDQCHWAQLLGEMPSLYCEADKSKTNYVYYDTANSRWACEDFRLTDDKPQPIGIDFIATKATYERDLSTAKATICLPYDLPVQGFKAYTLSGGNNSAVYFADAKDKLEAYKPYLLTANGTLQLGGENIQVKAYNADDLKQTAGAFSFIGTVTGVNNATAAAANAYILQGDGKFHKVTMENSAATVPPYHAYIICPKASGAKQLSIILDGGTTGIDGVTDSAAGVNGPVYDLQGRCVADRLDDAAHHQLPAGAYIIGGRKVIIK